MARTRNIKPGFFQNEGLAELPFEGRLLFAGLPTLADRAGRLEDRPRRIKAALFPFDGSVAVDDLLADLAERGFITRYQVEAVAVIQITNFLKHQSPHPKEPESVLPEKPNKKEKPRLVSGEPVSSQAGSSFPSFPSGSSGSAEGSSEPPAAASEPESPALMVFSCVGQTAEWSLRQMHVDGWQAAYPNIDVLAECRKALVWLQASPNRRKTAGGMQRFLVNWMSRAVNTGGDRRSGGERRTERPFTAQELADARRVRSQWFGGCKHEPPCENHQACIATIIRKWRAEQGDAA